MTDKLNFGGYKWEGILSCYRFEETKAFHDSINWEALCQFASKLNNNEPCTMDSQTTMGGRNLIRIIVFNSGTQVGWRQQRLEGYPALSEPIKVGCEMTYAEGSQTSAAMDMIIYLQCQGLRVGFITDSALNRDEMQQRL